MRSDPEPWFILYLIQFKDQINPNPDYQRPSNRWTEQDEGLLIDSILRGYDIPKIYFAASSDPSFDYEIVDGQQRIRAIWKYFDDKFPLPSNSKVFDGLGNLSGKIYSQLPIKAQQALGKYTLSVVILSDTNREELEELFRRLQKGKRITPVEYRNSLSGEIRDFAVDVGDTHGVFSQNKNQEKELGLEKLNRSCLMPRDGRWPGRH